MVGVSCEEKFLTTIRRSTPEVTYDKKYLRFYRKILPSGSYPFVHQARTFDYIEKGLQVCLVSGTSSGKTYAVAVPLFSKSSEKNELIFWLAPTKALMLDLTQRALSRVAEIFDMEVYPYFGEQKLPERRKALAKEITVATPDVVAWAFNRRAKWARDHAITHLRTRIVVDEVHLFKGYALQNLYYTLLRLKLMGEYFHLNPRFYFLSATTSPKLISVLRKAVGDMEIIVGDSLTGEIKVSAVTNWYRLREREKIEYIGKACEMEGKKLFIFNSAYRTHRYFNALREEGYDNLFIYTGKLIAEERDPQLEGFIKSRGATLLATSAVSVGVDFDVDHLFFESAPSDEFLQRLGRVGRSGKDGNCTILFTSKTFKKLEEALKGGVEFSRVEFSTIVFDVLGEIDPRFYRSLLVAYVHYRINENFGDLGKILNQKMFLEEEMMKIPRDTAFEKFGFRNSLPTILLGRSEKKKNVDLTILHLIARYNLFEKPPSDNMFTLAIFRKDFDEIAMESRKWIELYFKPEEETIRLIVEAENRLYIIDETSEAEYFRKYVPNINGNIILLILADWNILFKVGGNVDYLRFITGEKIKLENWMALYVISDENDGDVLEGTLKSEIPTAAWEDMFSPSKYKDGWFFLERNFGAAYHIYKKALEKVKHVKNIKK